MQRIYISEILENDWFKKGYKPPHFEQGEDVNLDEVDAVFNDSDVRGSHSVLRLLHGESVF